jgi:hypothetical protein
LPRATGTEHHERQIMKRILISAVVGLVIGLVLGGVVGHKLPPTPEQVVDYVSHMTNPEALAVNKELVAVQSWLQICQTQLLPPAPAGVPAAPGR